MANAIDQLTDRVLVLGRLTIVRRAITAVAVTISAVLQTFLIQAFIQPADLLPSGLTGVAVLLDRVTSLGGVESTSRSACSRSTSPWRSYAGAALANASSSSR